MDITVTTGLVLGFCKAICADFIPVCLAKPLAVPEEICAPLPRLCLISFDRCTFLALLHPPSAGTPNALKFASGNPFGGAKLVYP